MASVNIKVNLATKAAELQLQQLGRTARGTAAEFTKFSGNIKGFGNDFSTAFRQGSLAFGQFGTIIRSGIIGGGLFGLFAATKKSIQAFADFEEALVEVGKVTNTSGDELRQLGQAFQQLSLKTPRATNELLELGAEAARLGVRGSANILKFADTAARLAVSTNVSGRDAVVALSRIINITGEAQNSVGDLGDALVALGNNFAASEDDILSAARIIAQRAGAFGLAGREILGISTALKAAGVASEIGGSAIGTFFTNLTKGASTGSTQFKNFATILGKSTNDLSIQLKENSAGVLSDFVDKLGEIRKNGGDVVKALNSIGVSEKRALAVFLTLTQTGDQFARALNLANTATGDLARESTVAFQTVNSSIVKLNNAFTAIFTNLGEANVGIIKDTINGLAAISEAVADSVKVPTEFERLQNEYTELKNAANRLKREAEEIREELAKPLPETFIDKVKASIDRSFNDERAVEFKLFTAENLDKQAEELKIKLEQLKPQINEAVSNLNNNETGQGAGISLISEKELSEQQERIMQLLSSQAEYEQNKFLLLSESNLILSEEQNAQLLRDQEILNQKLEAEKINAALSIENEKQRQAALFNIGKESLERQSRFKQAEQRLELDSARARANILSNLGNLINSIAGRDTKAAFLLQKAAAAAQILIADSQARAAATTAAAIASIAAVPGTNLAVFAANKAAYDSLITANTGISLAAVAASAIKGFEQGGIVPGNSFSGDRVTARVNSGEMILNRSQQAQLFAQANGRQAAANGGEIVVHTTVELDGAAVAKAVSRQVNDGTELGEFI